MQEPAMFVPVHPECIQFAHVASCPSQPQFDQLRCSSWVTQELWTQNRYSETKSKGNNPYITKHLICFPPPHCQTLKEGKEMKILSKERK